MIYISGEDRIYYKETIHVDIMHILTQVLFSFQHYCPRRLMPTILRSNGALAAITR